MLNARIAEYLRCFISNEDVIKELLKMAQELKANAEQAYKFGRQKNNKRFTMP